VQTTTLLVFVLVYLGVEIGWRSHACVGVPVTLVTLAIAASWLWLRAAAF
jgi:hypothetical protein